MDSKTATTHVESIHHAPTKNDSSDMFIESNESMHNIAELPDSLKSLSPEEIDDLAKKTKRKLDFRILSIIVTIYILNYLDRNNIATARLGGLEKELKLKGNQYQTALSILFLGYVSMQVPFNILMTKFSKPSIMITTVMLIWGIISTCTGAVQNFAGLMVVRIMLGFVEAGFFCASLFYLSYWYTRKELATRNSIFYCGSIISGAFGGLIASGIIKHLDGAHGLRAWRWLFIIEGAMTVGFVPIAYFVLPDKPHNTKWLSQQERDVIMWKLRCDVGEDDVTDDVQDNSIKNGLKLAVSDPKVWMFTGMLSLVNIGLGVTNFFPTVVQTLKFDRTTTLLLTAPPYIIACIWTYLWALHADKTGERMWHQIIPMLISIVAFVIAVATTKTGARYFAMCLMPAGLFSSIIITLSWCSNTVPRPTLKRAIALGIANCSGNSTSIWTTYLYGPHDAPRFTLAFAVNIGALALAVIMTLMQTTWLKCLNKKIENGTMNWEKELGKGKDGSTISSDFRYLH